jgi:hypothetical protein
VGIPLDFDGTIAKNSYIATIVYEIWRQDLEEKALTNSGYGLASAVCDHDDEAMTSHPSLRAWREVIFGPRMNLADDGVQEAGLTATDARSIGRVLGGLLPIGTELGFRHQRKFDNYSCQRAPDVETGQT